MRMFIPLITLAAAFVLSSQSSAQLQYPTAPVRILVPFAAGGPTDVVARILADLLSAHWSGKSVVVENRRAPVPSWRPPRSPRRRPTAIPC